MLAQSAIGQSTGEITKATVNDDNIVASGDFFDCEGEATVTAPAGPTRVYYLKCWLNRIELGNPNAMWEKVDMVEDVLRIEPGDPRTGTLSTDLDHQSDVAYCYRVIWILESIDSGRLDAEEQDICPEPTGI